MRMTLWKIILFMKDMHDKDFERRDISTNDSNMLQNHVVQFFNKRYNILQECQ